MLEIPYINPNKDKGHGCGYLLVSCMDFRFHQYLENSLGIVLDEENCVFDYRGVVGGSKALLYPIGRRQVFKSINLAIKKHHIKTLILADHVDCGAYGGSSKHESLELEESFHEKNLKIARIYLKKRFPALNIILLYQDWHSIKQVR